MSSSLQFKMFACVAGFLSLFLSCGPDVSHVKNLHTAKGEEIIAFGDSITTGHGVGQENAYPARLSRIIGRPVVPYGRDGDTTGMALERVAEVLKAKPWIVLVELGGNDFLKERPKQETGENLVKIIEEFQNEGAIVVLLGMELGLFVDEYEDIYAGVAEKTGVYYIPSINRGILDRAATRQSDRIHPNKAGHQKLAERLADELKPLLKEAAENSG